MKSYNEQLYTVTSLDKNDSFSYYVFKSKAGRTYTTTFLICVMVEFIVFKILYPFPDFISDSYSYIETNLYHMKVNLWPIGYSKFIALIHLISPSHQLLVFIQYMLLQISLLYFFFSVLFIYHLTSLSRILLFTFLFINPIFLYLSNCILSDSLFCTISILLITVYLWMLTRPTVGSLILQGVLIGAAFCLRYTAIYYPLVAAATIMLCSYKWPFKILGIALPWVFIVPFIYYTQQKTKEITGTAEFSVFGGWQLANNALYMYDHINVDTAKLPSDALELDRLARDYFRKVPPEYRDVTLIEGTFFIKMPNAVLKPFMMSRTSINDAYSEFLAWGKVSPIYKRYGIHLIKSHPLAFARYYLLLNTQNYFTPYPEKFGSYNMGITDIFPTAKKWFGIKENELKLVPSIEFQGYVFLLYPLFFAITNFYFAGCLAYFLFMNKSWNTVYFLRATMIVLTTFLVLNFCFSVFATPVVLRYQVVPMILLVSFSIVLTERIYFQITKQSKLDAPLRDLAGA